MDPETVDLIDEIDEHRARVKRLVEAAEGQIRDLERSAERRARAEAEAREGTGEAVRTLRRAGLLSSR